MSEKHIDESHCVWCTKQFTPRRTGGHAQKYCAPKCRQNLHTLSRKWAEAAIENGDLSIDDLRHFKQHARSQENCNGH